MVYVVNENDNDRDDEKELEKCDDCEFCIKYCCIDFKQDCLNGGFQSYVQTFVKLVGLAVTVAMIVYVFYKAHNVNMELVRKEWQPSTTTTPAPDKMYSSDWSDLEKRPVPRWYDEAKIGIHVNWGIYSVVGYGPDSEQLWANSETDFKCSKFLNRAYGSVFNYRHLVSDFTAKFFDPNFWAKLFAKSGAKYVMITSRDTDGYALFPSDNAVGWNSVANGPQRDVIGELEQAIRQYKMQFGIYYSTAEKDSPILFEDKINNFSITRYRDQILWPDLVQLVFRYRPALVYLGEISSAYFNIKDFLSWLFSLNPLKEKLVAAVVLGVNRVHYGKFRFPKAWLQELLHHHTISQKFCLHDILLKRCLGPVVTTKFEDLIKLDKWSIGYRHNLDLSDVRTAKEMLFGVISVIAEGGNAVINISPKKDGIIPLIYQKRLLELGKWLEINGEAVYGSVPWKAQTDDINSQAIYTCTVTKVAESLQAKWMAEWTEERIPYAVFSVYVIYFKWPMNGRLRLRFVAHLFINNTHQVEFLEQPFKYLNYTLFQNGAYREVEIQLPKRTTVMSKHAWVLRIRRLLSNDDNDNNFEDIDVDNNTNIEKHEFKSRPEKRISFLHDHKQVKITVPNNESTSPSHKNNKNM